jgi:hypothetical protein
MGRITALGIAESNLSLEEKVSWHFSFNCYPPVPSIMVPVAVEAINMVTVGDDHELVNLPEGVTYRGENQSKAIIIVDEFHLFDFVGEYDEDNYHDPE